MMRPHMGRFEVKIFSRRLEEIFDSAEQAYKWLDLHAEPGDRYLLSAVGLEGVAVPVDEDFYAPPRKRRQRGRATQK
jgi:hypothetical protein